MRGSTGMGGWPLRGQGLQESWELEQNKLFIVFNDSIEYKESLKIYDNYITPVLGSSHEELKGVCF